MKMKNLLGHWTLGATVGWVVLGAIAASAQESEAPPEAGATTSADADVASKKDGSVWISDLFPFLLEGGDEGAPLSVPESGDLIDDSIEAGMPAIDRPEIPPPERPDRSELIRRELSVEELVDQFRRHRESLLQERESARRSIAEQLREAGDQQREELLIELRDRQRSWLTEQKAAREEIQERIQSIRSEFANRERDALLDRVKEEAAGARDRLRRD